MKVLRRLLPQEKVSSEDEARGLKALLIDGVMSQIMGVLAGGAFLTALALKLGASNVVIGLIASIGPATQLLQIPAFSWLTECPIENYWSPLVV